MSNRTTEKDLKFQVEYLNDITGNPKDPYSKNEAGEYKSNIGNYHLSFAYGGATLHRMANDAGSVNTPLGGGYFTKRELYQKINAFISGIQIGKDQIK